MLIKFDKEFEYAYIQILNFIASDKASAADTFSKELKKLFELLKENPLMFKASQYFEDSTYRDLTYKGYTIIYKIGHKDIMILEIFKWIDR